MLALKIRYSLCYKFVDWVITVLSEETNNALTARVCNVQGIITRVVIPGALTRGVELGPTAQGGVVVPGSEVVEP